MRQRIQKWLLTGSLFAIMVVIMAAIAGNAHGDGDAPKNLKILDKKTSREDVRKYMKEKVAKGLGVQCDFCHNMDDLATDTPKKKRAREMMQMVKDVNTKTMKGKELVGCVTCHRGKEKPDAK